VGTFGILSLYISMTSLFLFWGGSSAVIKFLPELPPEQRLSFLISYFLIVLGTTLPYQIAASIWPHGLRYILGDSAANWLGVVLVWLAPLCILFSLVTAALKGLLEIKWAQIYNRLITVISFIFYVGLFLTARASLATHYEAIIWSLYFTISIVVTILATRRLLFRLGERQSALLIRFYLPRGFWYYTLGLQSASILNFLNARLDYIFILNAGGLVVFGQYVALLTLVSVVPTFAMFVLDSLLPSLTNTLAQRDYVSSRYITEVYLRFLAPFAAIGTVFAVLFLHPLFALLGSRYLDLASLGLIAFPVAGLQALNNFLSTICTAIGIPHWDAGARAVRLVVFASSFWILWNHFHLLGAICAWGIGEALSQLIVLFVLLRKVPFQFAFFRTYWALLAAIGTSVVLAKFLGVHGVVVSLLAGLAVVAGFFLGAGYNWGEIRKISHLVLPSKITQIAFT
jgi:O-antigen/teichoic acid export membrane protein